MKTLILSLFFGLSLLVMAACAKRELSLDELEKLIPGSEGIEAESGDYVFEGNHAGYFIVLQSQASKKSIENLISASNLEPEAFIEGMMSDYRERFHMRFRTLGLDVFPDWFRFEPSPNSQKFRLRGSNTWTSEFLYDVIYDPNSETLWLEGGGI